MDEREGKQDPLRCIWMDAGLVVYKLCDREYECDACPLDLALRGVEPTFTKSERPRIHKPPWDFPADRHYSTSHGWIRPVKENTLRCGVDGFAAFLLERVRGIALPVIRSPLSRGRPAGWFMEPGETIPFMAPVSGSVLQLNKEVQAAPGLVTGSPYDEGWLLDVQSDRPIEGMTWLLSADQMKQRTTEQVEELSSRMRRNQGHVDSVGETLPDGGERLKGLRRILGPSRYLELVLSLLS